jgi:hypothetical protein
MAATVSMDRGRAQDSASDPQELVGRIHTATRHARERQQLSLHEQFDYAHLRYAQMLKEIGRGPYNQIGLAMAWNATNMSVFQGSFARPSETMLEFYWSWPIFNTTFITPDIQLYLQPALSPSDYVAAVFTIRLTQLF